MATAPSPQDLSPGAPDHPAGQKRKRLPRALLACESCRSRKLRCDQLSPCTNCSKRSLDCQYRSLDIPLPTNSRRQEGEAVQAFQGTTTESAIKRQNTFATPGPHHTSPILDFNPSHYRDISQAQSSNAPQWSRPPTNHAEQHSSYPTDLSTPQHDAEAGTDSFGEVNRHTQGTEFYGPTGIYSFLKRLRSRARTQGTTKAAERPDIRNTRDARDLSIVNLLHSSDFPVSYPSSLKTEGVIQNGSAIVSQANPNNLPSPSPTYTSLKRNSVSEASGSAGVTPTSGPFALLSNSDIEKECVRLYFQNLHLVHPILDQTSFVMRCENEIWDIPESPAQTEGSHSVFLALFNAVLAIGAINAGEDALFMRDTTTVRQAERYAGGLSDRAPTYPPLKLAKLFFERAKTNLGDVFEACSLESTQTLLLMAVFCQNALKPHSCYLYCGMAVRSALAIGVPNYTGPEAAQASALWWNLYSFEIEMCASAGRESSLREPSHYRLQFPHILAPEDPKQAFTSHMIALAQLMDQLSQEIYQTDDPKSLVEKSSKCLDIDRRLIQWKNNLPRALDFDKTSLVEPEWVAKQKVVLRNRFLNSRILIHRPFLIAAATASDSLPYQVHVQACVTASFHTIESLYEMYKHRPYFRTWWYNTTYTLYASMILLYVVLSNIETVDHAHAITDVEKSLEIFSSMNMVTVARRCAEIVQEVLDIAKKAMQAPESREGLQDAQNHQAGDTGLLAESDLLAEFEMSKEDLYASLVDSNLMDGFAPFDNGFFDIPDFNSVLGSGPFS